MPGLPAEKLGALLDGACGACGRRHFDVRLLSSAKVTMLGDEVVSSVEWLTPLSELAARAYRVECSECRAVAWESAGECPLCSAPGGLARALGGRHGTKLPPACPHCDYEELKVTAELRAHVTFVLGKVARRVADASAHDAGWHATEAECPSCEAKVASLPMRCGACGRSSLVRR